MLRTASILNPDHPRWDEARQAWNLAVDQHPAAIALPGTADGVADVVKYARAQGLRVAAQATGHNAGPLGSLDDTILLRTAAMREVSIDPGARVARAAAGALGQDVVDAAAEHGLAALAGTSPDTGVVGYTIGGGISWLGRSYGLSASNVTAIEAVTADGTLVRADASHETDLFWALRGGGGSFGVVTAIELRLFPITEVYAGQLWWPAEAALPVLRAWRELTASGPPDAFTTAARLASFPQLPFLPDHLAGQSFVICFVNHLGKPSKADSLLAPLRALKPVNDTIATIPVRELSQLHMDPEEPTRSIGDALLLDSLPADAIEAFIRTARPENESVLLWAEVLQLGGEMGRAGPGNGALAALDAGYQLSMGGRGPSPQADPAVRRTVTAVTDAMRPWAARQMYLNLADTSRDPASFWTPQAYGRLRRIKAAVDPDNLIRANHPVPPQIR